MRRSFCVLTFSMPNFIFGCSSTVNCAMLMLQIYRIYSNYPNKKVSNFEKNRIFLQYIHNSFSFTILSLKGTISLSDQNFQFPTQILNFLSVFIPTFATKISTKVFFYRVFRQKSSMEKFKNSNLGWAEVVYDDFHLSGREYVLFVQVSVSCQFIVKCGYAVQPAPESPQGAVIGHRRVVEVCQFRLCVRSDSKVFIHSFHSIKFIIYSLKLLISNRLCK